MIRLLTRLVRIRWTGFATTRHWLRGIAFVDYVMREELLPHLRDGLNAPNLLFERLMTRPEA